MKRYLSKIIAGLLLITLFNISIDIQKTFANANHIRFTETTVVLMPEYNKHPNKEITEPNLLVGFHGTLLNQSQEPLTDITIPIPSNETNFNLSLVASSISGETEEVTEIDYTLQEKGETITLTLDKALQPGATQKIMLEYFYTPMAVNETQKSFTYEFKAFADAVAMNLILFEPYYAEEFTAVPESDKKATDSMGVKMHLYQYQDIKQGDTNSYEFSYKKEGHETTIEMVEQITSESLTDESNIAAPTSGDETTGSSEGFLSSDEVFALILITIIVAGFIFLFIRKGQGIKTQGKMKTVSKVPLDKKELRRMLAEGEIDEIQYTKELSKLG